MLDACRLYQMSCLFQYLNSRKIYSYYDVTVGWYQNNA
ncbi:unnamed protein product [Brugia timori]|uniref:Uncharacterized protein n=1 Tax=Brugia timori TaxID=42155 RepID=A0A0R3Q9M6_9BILA|nr:unnamed protein product [Brugia timori]